VEINEMDWKYNKKKQQRKVGSSKS
jgi:hypothetical protein